MRTSPSTIDRAARIARRQHGVVTRGQLLAAGWSRDRIRRWLAKGLLHRVHRGVYRFGHCAPSVEAAYLAAVLAAGDGAALCGFAAAHLLGARPRAAAPEITGPVDLRLRGVVTRRLVPLAPEDVRVVGGIRATTPARTIVDLAGVASLDALAEIAHRLSVRRRLGAAEVLAAMSRRGRVNGAAKLRAVYEGDTAVLLSRLERRFVAMLRAAALPAPETNRLVQSFYVDCRWPASRLTVELLGYRFHASRHAWQRDQRRAREAYARGDEFRSYTWDDVTKTPGVIVDELTPLLRADRAG